MNEEELNYWARELRAEFREQYRDSKSGLKSALNWLRIGILVLGSLTVSDAVVTYNAVDDTEENTIVNVQQDARINTLEQQLASINLKSELGIASVSIGMCSCVNKDNTVQQLVILCKSKNPVCDKESREICESVHTEFEC